MGYYTDFEINASEEVVEAIKEECGVRFYNGSALDCKWYSWKKDLKEISKRFPDQTIELEGHGEGDWFEIDMWKARFKNGKVEVSRAKPVFGEYVEE